jgi:hypothetical protein
VLSELTADETERMFGKLELACIKLLALAGYTARKGSNAESDSYLGTSDDFDDLLEDLFSMIPGSAQVPVSV